MNRKRKIEDLEIKERSSKRQRTEKFLKRTSTKQKIFPRLTFVNRRRKKQFKHKIETSSISSNLDLQFQRASAQQLGLRMSNSNSSNSNSNSNSNSRYGLRSKSRNKNKETVDLTISDNEQETEERGNEQVEAAKDQTLKPALKRKKSSKQESDVSVEPEVNDKKDSNHLQDPRLSTKYRYNQMIQQLGMQQKVTVDAGDKLEIDLRIKIDTEFDAKEVVSTSEVALAASKLILKYTDPASMNYIVQRSALKAAEVNFEIMAKIVKDEDQQQQRYQELLNKEKEQTEDLKNRMDAMREMEEEKNNDSNKDLNSLVKEMMGSNQQTLKQFGAALEQIVLRNEENNVDKEWFAVERQLKNEDAEEVRTKRTKTKPQRLLQQFLRGNLSGDLIVEYMKKTKKEKDKDMKTTGLPTNPGMIDWESTAAVIQTLLAIQDEEYMEHYESVQEAVHILEKAIADNRESNSEQAEQLNVGLKSFVDLVNFFKHQADAIRMLTIYGICDDVSDTKKMKQVLVDLADGDSEKSLKELMGNYEIDRFDLDNIDRLEARFEGRGSRKRGANQAEVASLHSMRNSRNAAPYQPMGQRRNNRSNNFNQKEGKKKGFKGPIPPCNEDDFCEIHDIESNCIGWHSKPPPKGHRVNPMWIAFQEQQARQKRQYQQQQGRRARR